MPWAPRVPPVPPWPETPAGEDRRPPASLAGLRSLWLDRGALGNRQSPGICTYDAAYVENLLLAERRRRQLPTPTLPTPHECELIDDIELEPADPAVYDRFCNSTDEDQDGTT